MSRLGTRCTRSRTTITFGAKLNQVTAWNKTKKRLTAFTASYSQAAVIFPYVLVAPAYFAKKVQLGGMTQTASAFGSVQKALSVFVTIYRTLADWRAVVARLDGFETSIGRAAAVAHDAHDAAHRAPVGTMGRNSLTGLCGRSRWQPCQRRLYVESTSCQPLRGRVMGRGILLWLLGVPIPIILLLALCSHH